MMSAEILRLIAVPFVDPSVCAVRGFLGIAERVAAVLFSAAAGEAKTFLEEYRIVVVEAVGGELVVYKMR